MIDRFKNLIKFYPKFRYKLKYIAGDLFYEEMSFEEACEKIFIYADNADKQIRC
jgi:hypothetical protein